MKLKVAQVALVRDKLLTQQEHVCVLCGQSFKGRNAKKPALDHDHKTGYVRDVLCLNCNRREGEIFNRARTCMKDFEEEWVSNLVGYWKRHREPRHGGLIYPTHKTDVEKRLERNAKARKKRAALKKAKT